MRKVARTVADIAGLVLGVVGIVFAATGYPGGIEYTALVILAALGLISVAGGDLAEAWTSWQPRRHHLLGSVSLFGGLGGLALRELIGADNVGEVIFHALGVLILLPFALIALFGWFGLGKQS